MKYCITLQLREFDSITKVPFFTSIYYETKTIRDLNDWLHHNVCNTDLDCEIINMFFELEKEY